jgi:hypothetical protein
LLGQFNVPCCEVGPIWIDLAPNLAEAAAAQRIELGADRNDACAQCDELIALWLLSAKLDRQTIGFDKGLLKVGQPVRPGTRDRFR